MKEGGSFFAELLRRKVVRMVGAYIAVFWLLAQGILTLGPALGFPDSVGTIFIYVGIVGILPLAYFSWKYDLVPPQLIRDPQDVEAVNPALSWAMVRHDNLNAGYVLLSWTAGDGAQTEKRFFKPVSFGREANNDIELPDQRVSRHHAVIWAQDGSWHVRDLDSGNGTFIGHTRVTGTSELPQTCDLRFHPNGPIISVHIGKSAETLVG